MSAQMWSVQDGLISVSSDAIIAELLADAHAHAHQVHLGTRAAHHRTVQDALDANDVLWAHRLVATSVQAMTGELNGPMAPRAAVGPDLACFALGTRNTIKAATFRAEHVAGWGRLEVRTIELAVEKAQALTERGCTLIEIHEEGAGLILSAALPRSSLMTLVQRAEAPPVQHGVSHATWPVPWTTVPAIWNRMAYDLTDHGTLLLQALDSHLCLLRLVGTESNAPGKAELRTVMTRYLGATRMTPPEVARAFRLRSLSTGQTRA